MILRVIQMVNSPASFRLSEVRISKAPVPSLTMPNSPYRRQVKKDSNTIKRQRGRASFWCSPHLLYQFFCILGKLFTLWVSGYIPMSMEFRVFYGKIMRKTTVPSCLQIVENKKNSDIHKFIFSPNEIRCRIHGTSSLRYAYMCVCKFIRLSSGRLSRNYNMMFTTQKIENNTNIFSMSLHNKT